MALPVLAGLLLAAAAHAASTSPVTVTSPHRRTSAEVSVEGGHLVMRVLLRGRTALETSPIGIVVDGADLGEGALPETAKRYAHDERFPWRGVHSEGRDECRGAEIPLRRAGGSDPFTLDVRVFDDAVAYRWVVPGTGRRVPDAGSVFRLPAGSLVWVQGPRDHYESLYARKKVEEVADGEWATPPLVAQLPSGLGFVAITEAALRDYAGMMLQGDGARGFRERLGHSVPASYPFELRYGKDNAARLAVPAPALGTITTPWRVVLVGADLDTLVNSDAIAALNPPPDPKLFPAGMNTPWIRPGRAVWRYLDSPRTPPPPPGRREPEPMRVARIQRGFDEIKEFSRLAGLLGFEHQVVEGLWRDWSDDQIKEQVAYAAERHVSLWFWLHSRDQRDPEKRRELFARLHGLGVAGIKVDFFDHEAREVIDLYEDIRRDAAGASLMVMFHGANKPTGEARTWPNEMTREAIRGLEYGTTPSWSEHDTTVPFTRFLAGPADFTPVIFGPRRKETSWAHQIATAVVFTSPLMVYAANPRAVLDNPAADLIKSLPSVWDETRVLPASAIGEGALFARRTGDTWFLGVLNGPAERTLKVPLRFLGKGTYAGTLVKDRADDAAAVEVEDKALSRADVLEVRLRAGGGFVGRFRPRP